VFD
jgi:hypothetical protein